MTFGERMKELLDQGVTVSKDLLDQGVTKSKELAVKAGAKAQDLGERGMLMLEIKQLESQAQKLIGRLGAEVYQAFSERGEEVVSKDSAAVKAILADITSTKESIESKESELKLRKNNK